jgi:hypothetical protein
MRRLRPLLLASSLVACLAPVASGCGSSDVAAEEVPGPPPDLTIPRERGADDPLADTGNTADQTTKGDATPTPTPTSTPAGSGSTTAPAGTGSTGTSAPTATPQADGPGNDQAPAAGTAPDKFEEFCQQNAGAC